jgi:type II secretory pathway component GspD/PulD (secretin)
LILVLSAALAMVWFSLAPAQEVGSAEDTGELITLEADSTPVVVILEILAQRSGLNIVTSPEVQGIPISIKLSNTPFEEALNLVVRAAGMGYERVGSSILVSSPQRLANQTGLITRVYELEYANATEVEEALTIVTENLTSYVAGNQIVVKAPTSVMEELSGLVASLDRRPQQVMLQARLLEVNTTSLKELGIDWESITKWTTIVTEGNPVVSNADALPDQLGYFKVDETDDFYRQAEAFEVTVDALITNGTARLLANSKVTTMENQPASIFIGETIPVVITSLQSGQAGGTFQSVQLDYIDVGIKLDIEPRVASDGSITVNVMPEVSNIVGFVGPDNDLPRTSTRRASARIRVGDGQTFYLGGLLNEEERETQKKVPLLGDIPLLGYFFRHYRIEKIKTDLLIEITPTIIREQG